MLCLRTPVAAAPPPETCPDGAALEYQRQQAAAYLNGVRSAPAEYGRRIGLALSGVTPAPQLRWNDRLSAVAQQKAESLARNNYFSHQNLEGVGPNLQLIRAGYSLPDFYPRGRDANSVESLAGGAPNAVEAVDQLILDEGVPGAYHRVHLLAMDEFYREHTEVGVGIACNPASVYLYYYVILTAPSPASDTQIAGVRSFSRP